MEKEFSIKDFQEEKLSVSEAAQFVEMSVPSFNRRVKAGIFKKHGSGRKVFYLKSELVNSLINSVA